VPSHELVGILSRPLVVPPSAIVSTVAICNVARTTPITSDIRLDFAAEAAQHSH